MTDDATADGPTGDEPPGLWLQRQRKAAGLTQEDLAERSGLSVRTVRNLERGAPKPHPRSLHLLAAALNLPEPGISELIATYRASQGNGAASPHSPAGRPPSGWLPAAVGDGSGQAGPSRRVLPQQLPPTVSHFAGRTVELAILDGWLHRAAMGGAGETLVISAIGGMAGVGKTALALHWAHRVVSEFPDGQLYANLRGYDPGGQAADAAEILRGFLDALGVPPDRLPADPDRQTGLYRSLLAGRRMLIVADNAKDAAQVRPLLPGAPGCLVLVTTRSPLAGLAAADGAHVLNLEVPTAAEATELISARMGSDRVAAEPRAAAELIRLCGKLPLALAIVAARAAASSWPLDVLAGELADGRKRLGALGINDAAADVRSVFSWSYRKLSPAAARMFRLLGIHPGPEISVPAAASLAGLAPPGAQELLRDLMAVGLIAERVPGRYGLHDLLRSYAAEQAHEEETEEERRAATCRTLEHYLHTANSAARMLDPPEAIPAVGPPRGDVTPEVIISCDQALGWFRAEHKVLLEVIAQIAGQDLDDYARQLPWALMPFFDRAGQWHELAASQNVALACAERLDDLAGQARAHRDMGRALIHLGDLSAARAHLAQAAALSHQLGDRPEEARAWLGLSVAFLAEGQPADSLSSSRQALMLAEAAGDLMLQAKASNNVGYDYAILGDPRRGLVHCQQALSLYRQISKPFLEAHTWDSLGYIYFQLGDYQLATTSYRRAVGLFRETSAFYESAQSLTRLGDIQAAASNAEAARDTWQEALAILDNLAHPEASQIRSKLRAASENAEIGSR